MEQTMSRKQKDGKRPGMRERPWGWPETLFGRPAAIKILSVGNSMGGRTIRNVFPPAETGIGWKSDPQKE